MGNSFDPETHSYTVGGTEVPSVTQIVDVVTAAFTPAVDRAFLTMAAERGRRVHEICEYLDYGCDPDELDIEPDYAGYVRAYMDFTRDYSPKWEYIETPMYGKSFAGTPDRYGTIDGQPVIADIKTTQNLGRIAKTKLACQLTGYELLCFENGLILPKCENMFGIQLHSSGKYTIHKYSDIVDKLNIDPECLFNRALYIRTEIGGMMK